MNDLETLRDQRLAVLCGGQSSEREVSFRSGRGICGALRRQGFDAVEVDPGPHLPEQLRQAGATVAYIALHGGAGEDGTIQAVLEYAGIAYTGSGVLACALTMDKVQTKRILLAEQLPTPGYAVIGREDDREGAVEVICRELGLPVVVKPIAEGSSFGVSIPKTEEDLRRDLAALVAQYGKALVEAYIAGTELTVGVVGVGERRRALPVLELVPHHEFYDFEAKYTQGLTDLIAPARISAEATAEAQRLALAAHRATDCVGVSRVDMHLDAAGRLWITEINTSPGMTETSDLPAAAESIGMSYDELVMEILRSAVVRK
jgi:D-alanine--D-alanine ligase